MINRPSGILLDIEGTTSSISFVHDVMFPFVLQHLDSFFAENWGRPDLQAACDQMAKDAGHASLEAWISSQSPPDSASELVKREIRRLMANDVKATGLKTIQGLIWKLGFDSGDLKSHVYADVFPAIQSWRSTGIDVRIYSSGSIAAQKMFFAHVEEQGNCLAYFSGHYDTTIGGKKEPSSYLRIAEDWGLDAGKILFISDILDELNAAQRAGYQAVASVRPGNTLLPEDIGIRTVDSFANVLPHPS